MPAVLNFDDFSLFQASFEVRYGDALLLWDRAGSIWTIINTLIPHLKPVQSEPNKVVFARKGDKEVQLSLETRRMGVIAVRPDNKLTELSEIVSRFVEVAVANLEITAFTRVGLRTSFVKEFPTIEAASDAFTGAEILNLPTDRLFGVAAQTIDPEIKFRREDATNGFSVQLRAELVHVEFDPNFGLSPFLPPVNIRKPRVHLDVDRYIHASVEVSKLYFADWISQTLHIVRRDSSKLFE